MKLLLALAATSFAFAAQAQTPAAKAASEAAPAAGKPSPAASKPKAPASKPKAPASGAKPVASAAKAAAAAPAVDLETLAGGIEVLHTKRGAGTKPVAADTVKVHYRGYFPEGGPKAGEEFDSSFKRNAPATFPLGRVIKCWTEGVATMQPGGKATLTCPSAVAYGERGTPGGPIGPNQTLKFDVELIEIVK